MKTKKTIFLLLLLGTVLGACKKEDQQEAAVTTISNIEIGLSNNEIGTIGKDFHFNADILAADKIENVQIKILPRNGETYSKAWKYELTWDSYKGVKNTNVHKHFDIPADAAEGKYDFVIIVNDQDGTKLELKRTITLYLEANLPVNPSTSIFTIYANEARFYRSGQFTNAGAELSKGDIIKSQITISGVKGSGKMYILLINSKLKHKPESIDQIDFTKAIVYDVLEHKDWPTVDNFTNSSVDPVTFQPVRVFPSFTIGGDKDNNLPNPGTITGVKGWESGTYYFGVVYQNTTYKMSYSKYIEIPIEIK